MSRDEPARRQWAAAWIDDDTATCRVETWMSPEGRGWAWTCSTCPAEGSGYRYCTDADAAAEVHRLGVFRAAILREAAAKLDAQAAAAHGAGVHYFADLLRVWAGDPSRWEAGT